MDDLPTSPQEDLLLNSLVQSCWVLERPKRAKEGDQGTEIGLEAQWVKKPVGS